MDKKQTSLIAFGITLVLFFAVNILSASTLRSARLDLTESGLYSLSKGTEEILGDLEEPITLRLFFSEKLADSEARLQPFATYAQRVEELLEEYSLLSDGMIDLRVIDPEPFSEAEDQAVAAGVANAPVTRNEKFYFGLVGTSSTDDERVIPFLDPSEEPLLEYEITKLVYDLAHPERGVVGIVSPLQLEGSPAANPMMGQQGTPPWGIVTQLREGFEVRMLGERVHHVPSDVDVLLVVHPKDLSGSTKYAIDQFVLRGGRAIAFVDPWAMEDDPPQGADRMAALSHDRGSSLDPLLEAWGLRLVPDKIVADRALATPVSAGGVSVDFVAYLTLGRENYNEDDAVVSLLDRMVWPTPGVLQEVEDTGMVVTPLVQSTEDSMQVDKTQLQYGPDPQALLRNFVPEGEELTLAARVTGPAETAFPGGRPVDEADETAPQEELEGSDEDLEHLDASEGDVQVIVVADVDLLADRYWLQRQSLGPIFLGNRKTADNGDFVVNCVDNLSGSDELISIRGRMKFRRPFTMVQEIEQTAEQRYLREVQDLEDKIREFERKISELQGQQAEGSDLILTEEQMAEIEKLQEERIASRKELRRLQYQMNKDTERLGMQLKVIHVAAVPLVFSLAALAFGMWRVKRRRS